MTAAGDAGTGKQTGPVNQWVPPELYSAALPKATVFACLMFTDEHDRLLQLRSVREQRGELWQWPGGNLDAPTETPWDVALRECAEETGIAFTGPARLLGTRFILPRTDWPYAHLGFVFDGGRLTNAQLDGIVLDPAEHTAWAVHSLDEWKPLMPAEQHASFEGFYQARITGIPLYQETRATL